MDTIKFPEKNCPLCDLELGDVSVPYNSDGRSRYYLCKNCGPYAISYMAYRFTPIISDEEIKTKLSYYTKLNSTEDKPIFIQKENYKELIGEIELPGVSEQLKNFLAWFGEMSNYSLDTVQSDVRFLVATIGCKNSKQVIHLLDELWSDKFVEMELPTTGPLRERATFRRFAAHLTTKGLLELEKNIGNKSFSFNIEDLTVEELLTKTEGTQVEVKGSVKLNLNRLFQEDHQKEKKVGIALSGVLKTLVGLLNTSGGHILVGAVEKDKYSKDEIKDFPYEEFGEYYLIGTKIENESQDKYELELRSLISEHIKENLVELLEISFKDFNNITLCIIKVSSTNFEWYYLDDDKFYVRDGNRTIELKGSEADAYKKRNSR